MPATPKVTVGMPVYNRANVLCNSIQQVLDQTFKDFEFIIYNDGSTDNTAQVVRSFNDDRIIFLDHSNLGPPYPLNAIYRLAKGEYIIILHDHDFFHPNLLEKSVKALDNNPDASFVLQGSAWINEDGESNYQAMLHDLPVINNGYSFGEKMIANKNAFSSIFHACSMIRRSSLEKVGMFYNPEYGLYADMDLWFRLLKDYNFVYLKEVLFKFRTREAEGHFLNNRQSEILDWQYQIQKANIKYYFQLGTVKHKIACQIVERKYIWQQVRLGVQAISIKNNQIWKKSLESLLKNKHQPYIIKALFKLINSSPIYNVLSQILPILNQWRKKIKRG